MMEFEINFRPRTKGMRRILPYHGGGLEDLDSRSLLNLIITNQKEQKEAIAWLQASLNQAEVKIDEMMLQQNQLQSRSEWAKRQTKHLRCQVDAIRKSIECVPRFSLFKELPTEVRLMIWEIALPCRTVTMADRMAPGGLTCFLGFDRFSQYGPPALAHTCKESRTVALRTGNFRPLQYRYMESSHKRRWKTQWGWFDGSRDTLALSTLTYSRLKEGCGMQNFTQIAQNVIAMPGGDLGGLLEILFDPATFPRLRSVGFQMGSLHAQFPMDVMEDIQMFGLEGALETFAKVEDVSQLDHLKEEVAGLGYEDFKWNLNSVDAAGKLHRSFLWTWSPYQDVLAREWRKRRPGTTQIVPSFRRVVRLFKWPEKNARYFLGELLSSGQDRTRVPSLSPFPFVSSISESSSDEEEG